MYKNILLPLGLSELNPAVLDAAGALAAAERAKVTLIHVVQTFEGEADDETEEFYNDLQQKAEGHSICSAAKNRSDYYGIPSNQQRSSG